MYLFAMALTAALAVGGVAYAFLGSSDGSRRITHITEVIGLEGDVVITQDLFLYEITGEDESGRVKGRHMSTGISRPAFWERARYFNREKELLDALEAAAAA